MPIRKTQAASKTQHEFFRDGLSFVHKMLGIEFEMREKRFVDPFVFHVDTELELVAFFLVCDACGRSDLALFFPSDVFAAEGDGAFDAVGECEEGLGCGEDGVNFCYRDFGIGDGEEAIRFCCLYELGCDFVDSTVEVLEADSRYASIGVLGGAHCASCNRALAVVRPV